MTKVVLKMIALILEGVEGFILGLPTGSATAHQGIDIAPFNGDVSDPGEMLFAFVGDFPVFEKIDQDIGIRLIQGELIDKMKTVGDPFSLISSSVLRPIALA